QSFTVTANGPQPVPFTLNVPISMFSVHVSATQYVTPAVVTVTADIYQFIATDSAILAIKPENAAGLNIPLIFESYPVVPGTPVLEVDFSAISWQWDGGTTLPHAVLNARTLEPSDDGTPGGIQAVVVSDANWLLVNNQYNVGPYPPQQKLTLTFAPT